MGMIEVFGAKMTAILAAIAIVYLLVSFAPVLWSAFVAWRNRTHMPHPILFVTVVAALVYGFFSFVGFAVLLPIEVYGIFVAPSLEEAGVAHGAGLLSVSRFFANYWWIFVPPVQLALTWFVTFQVGRRWQHICVVPANNSFKTSLSAGETNSA